MRPQKASVKLGLLGRPVDNARLTFFVAMRLPSHERVADTAMTCHGAGQALAGANQVPQRCSSSRWAWLEHLNHAKFENILENI